MANQNLKRERKIKNAEKQATARNTTPTEAQKIGDEVEMRVVACAGDPGLTEPWLFDILSRWFEIYEKRFEFLDVPKTPQFFPII